ncbi:hypothetical protein PENTCL1PPCAC_23556, partial [Pristionchus entomophagus]
DKDKTATTRTAPSAPPKKGAKGKKRGGTVEDSKDSNWSDEGKRNAANFMKTYADLGIDGIKAEYREKIESYKSPSYSDAAYKANMAKNRHKHLTTLSDDLRVSMDEGKRYINVSWLYDKTKVHRQYILTQTPLESTMEDFWTMVFEHKVIVVAILCDKQENGQEIMPDFWPTKPGDFKNYGNMAVSFKKSEEIAKEIVTQLEVLPEGCSNSHLVCIVQFKAWGETFTQSMGRNLLKVIRVIAKVEGLTAGPIAVMDELSGISRASIMCCADVYSALIYKGDKQATLPDVCKWARKAKPGAVKSEDDYLSIIKTIMEYLYRTNQEKFAEQFQKICGNPEDLN